MRLFRMSLTNFCAMYQRSLELLTQSFTLGFDFRREIPSCPKVPCALRQ